jgi:hypothetical protein
MVDKDTYTNLHTDPYIIHKIFVKVSSNDDKDTKSNKITFDLLKYINSIKPFLTRYTEIRIEIYVIKSSLLNSNKLVDALTSKKISRLPALMVSNNIVLGANGIKQIYNTIINRFSEKYKKQTRNPNTLEDFYKTEMKREQNDDDEEDISSSSESGKSLMSSFNRELGRRHIQAPKDEDVHSEMVDHSSQKDNIKYGDAIDKEISSTIDKISKGGGSVDDDPVFQETPDDDMMAKVLYTNLLSGD